MDEHPNAALLRQALDAMNAGDGEAINRILADDVEWHEIGNPNPIVGKQALNDRFMGDTPPDFEITGELHDVVANDEHAVGLVNAHATRGGKSLDYRTAEIVHVKDGKVTARWAFSDDTEAITSFFA